MECFYVPYACYAWLAVQPPLGCVAKHFAVGGINIHPHCKLLLLLNSGYVHPYYDVTSRKYSSVSLIMVLVSSTELVSRKSSFVISVYDASWQVPIGEPIASPI